jgi:ABC-type lipoprotein release transport system permease subunit
MNRTPAFLLGVGVGAFVLIIWGLAYIGFSIVKIDKYLTNGKDVTFKPTNRL